MPSLVIRYHDENDEDFHAMVKRDDWFHKGWKKFTKMERKWNVKLEKKNIITTI